MGAAPNGRIFLNILFDVLFWLDHLHMKEHTHRNKHL